jgi:hypothetical protein
MDPNDPILLAYQQLQQDRAGLDGLYGAKATADVALAKAQNDSATAGNALSSGVANFEADKTALVTLIQNTLNSGPPSPPVPPKS